MIIYSLRLETYKIWKKKDFGSTRTTFVKTADSKKRSTFYSNFKKTPTTTGFSYKLPNVQGSNRAKTPSINILF